MSPVRYRTEGAVATITMDDGKVNAVSPVMLAALHTALDQAVADEAVVVLRGRERLFSAGFDLTVLRAGTNESREMVLGGFRLAERLLSFPTPVVIECTGHAVAMGAFLVLTGDYRLGATGSYTLVANEVAIGLTPPHAAVEILRHRLTPAHFTRAVTLAEPFHPQDAVGAGFLDRVVEADDLSHVARQTAQALTTLDMAAYRASKLRARRPALAALHAAIAADDAEFRVDT